MSTIAEKVASEPHAQLSDCKGCGPHILHLRIQRRTSDGDCRTPARNFKETWKSAEMPEVRDEEIEISYQKKQVSGV